MAWSPDAKKLAYNISDDVGDRFGIYDFPTGNNDVDRFGGAMEGNSCHFPAWSRTDSDVIAWQVMIGTDRDIFVVDLDDLDNPVRLTNGGYVERFPCWSPDDSLIVFEVLSGKKGSATIVTMDSSDGSGRTTIQSGGGMPAWRRSP